MKKILLVCVVLLQAYLINAATAQELFEKWEQESVQELANQKMLQRLFDKFNLTLANKTKEILRVLTIDDKTDQFSPNTIILPDQTKSLSLTLSPVLHLATLSASAFIVPNSYDINYLLLNTYRQDLFKNVPIPLHLIIYTSINQYCGRPLSCETALKRYVKETAHGGMLNTKEYSKLFIMSPDPNKKMAVSSRVVLKSKDLKQSCVKRLDIDIHH